MPEEHWQIEFYHDDRGRSPVQDFIRSLDIRMRTKVGRNIEQLELLGSQLGMPLARPIAGYGFSELRVQLGSNIVRIFYLLFPGRRIVLLHGFVKKDQRTPADELAIAARRRAEFLRRNR